MSKGLQQVSRQVDLDRFYELLHQLENRLGGRRIMSQCDGRMPWPTRGVYFIFEPGEIRATRPEENRVVRVGTHALIKNSKSTLWQRLSQHRGTRKPLGGNHRGSIFRLLVGTALAVRHSELSCPTWGSGASADRTVREKERLLEAAVSNYIGQMKVLWLVAEDEPGPNSIRGYIERNTIALLSGFRRSSIDPPSAGWLGHHCSREKVRRSGLWNSNHVDEEYDPDFLAVLEQLVKRQGCNSDDE